MKKMTRQVLDWIDWALENSVDVDLIRLWINHWIGIFSRIGSRRADAICYALCEDLECL